MNNERLSNALWDYVRQNAASLDAERHSRAIEATLDRATAAAEVRVKELEAELKAQGGRLRRAYADNKKLAAKLKAQGGRLRRAYADNEALAAELKAAFNELSALEQHYKEKIAASPPRDADRGRS